MFQNPEAYLHRILSLSLLDQTCHSFSNIEDLPRSKLQPAPLDKNHTDIFLQDRLILTGPWVRKQWNSVLSISRSPFSEGTVSVRHACNTIKSSSSFFFRLILRSSALSPFEVFTNSLGATSLTLFTPISTFDFCPGFDLCPEMICALRTFC